MIESSAALKPWRADVTYAALAALEESPEWDRNLPHVSMHVVFTFPRPRSHFRTGKFAHLLRDGAPTMHGTKPDLDKLLRGIGDALTSVGAYADDSRVAHVYAVKTYVANAASYAGALTTPGARITLSPVGAGR